MNTTLDIIKNIEPENKTIVTQSIVTVLRSEIEWLEGEKKKYPKEPSNTAALNAAWHDLYGFNQALDQTITHLEEIIKELEVWY